uniref:Uncharacterized protein n=1 Tax=Chenopodium quinoa TaxID=63459 RepID=A0A803L5L0_CHEQI
MATSMDIECAYSTSPMKTTEPRLSYKISVSNNDHHQRVLQKWMHTVLCYKKQSDSEDNGLHAKGWIKESLGKALLEHPILAGRLRKSENNNGDLNIVSNDSGIRCPVYARISETTSGQRVHSMKATEPAKGRDRVNQVVLNTKEGGILQDQLVDTEMKKEACIRKGYPCEPYAKCCNSCVVDPIYGFFKCS